MRRCLRLNLCKRQHQHQNQRQSHNHNQNLRLCLSRNRPQHQSAPARPHRSSLRLILPQHFAG